MIYIAEILQQTFIKVGFTECGNFIARQAELQTGNPFEIKLVVMVEGTLRQEQTIHKALAVCLGNLHIPFSPNEWYPGQHSIMQRFIYELQISISGAIAFLQGYNPAVSYGNHAPVAFWPCSVKYKRQRDLKLLAHIEPNKSGNLSKEFNNVRKQKTIALPTNSESIIYRNGNIGTTKHVTVVIRKQSRKAKRLPRYRAMLNDLTVRLSKFKPKNYMTVACERRLRKQRMRRQKLNKLTIRFDRATAHIRVKALMSAERSRDWLFV